jgi:hypothetical protein
LGSARNRGRGHDPVASNSPNGPAALDLPC